MPAERPRRADARRNHDAVLAAARQLFAERGLDVPLDDVARRAGVGNATMYRHFPTRQDLIIAVYADEVTELCESGDALLAAGSPGDALHEWLGAFVAHVAGKRDLALALPRDGSARFGEWHEKMLATASALLTRAQDAGEVRADLTVRELMTLANAIALTGSDQSERLLDLLRYGIVGR
ncbi:TetR/AcrR family transcriptional regulator [Nonomuraea aurantiaca]|uniref:TetR/AcrR family transcriptional regulator n=1 Tax=Nonomuraea aurantiaca TaxID=2878562 RepID=UPI001CDA0851|nr:TetR/AcrR family transcriptional regulator [Nonomuraea aurantiaca]MCA2225441.1 TetR/AcrR family transcriptional regulator [Nonomuraea aurantiaca]